jgi:hypothetical protein
LESAREEALALFQRYCRRAFVPTYARHVLNGTGRDTLELPHADCLTLIGVSVDGNEEDVSEWKLTESGRLWRSSGVFSNTYPHNVVVRYEHGMRYVPADLKRAFIAYTAHVAKDNFNAMPDRTTGFNTETGLFVQVQQAGPNHATGLPEVDAVLNNYRQVSKGSVR